jgi:transposase-like protein
MARGKRTPDEVRAAVMAALLAGQGVSEISSTFDLPHQTVSDLKQVLEREFGSFGNKKDISEQILELLGTQLDALKTIAANVGRPEYVEKQPASEIAVLYGVISDKAFRIVSAIQTTQSEPRGTASELSGDGLPN